MNIQKSINEHNDIMFKQIFKKEAPATLVDPACDTTEFEANVEKETQRLLNNPLQIYDAKVEEFLAIYSTYRDRIGRLDADQIMANDINNYLYRLAENQARENV